MWVPDNRGLPIGDHQSALVRERAQRTGHGGVVTLGTVPLPRLSELGEALLLGGDEVVQGDDVVIGPDGVHTSLQSRQSSFAITGQLVAGGVFSRQSGNPDSVLGGVPRSSWPASS